MKIDIKKLVIVVVLLAVGVYLGGTFLGKDPEKVVVYENTKPTQDSGNFVKASLLSNKNKSASLQYLNQAFVNIAENVKPSVVTITAEKVVKRNMTEQDEFFRKFFGFPAPDSESRQTSLGSGVIVSDKGYILTNSHVIENGEKISVRLASGEVYKAEIIGSDEKTDIAVIKIEAGDLTSVRLGDSDALKVGEWVVAVGSPLTEQLAHTVTAGIVSAKARSINIGGNTTASFIQTDAAINPGNSGGALVNIEGELVGINTAIATGGGLSRGNIGIGFAIPVNLAQKIMEDLIETGHVERAWLGVMIGSITDPIARAMDVDTRTGALVNEVVEGSPAQKAGLKIGDVIIEYNDTRVEHPQHLTSMVSSSDIGEKAELKIIRDGDEKTIEVELGKRPEDDELTSGEMDTSSEELLGMKCKEINPQLAEQLEIDIDEEGVVVVGLKRGTESAQKLRHGDIIRRIGKKTVTSLEDLKEGYEQVKDKQYILLLIKREQHTVFITLENE
ncbi:MAG: Do family serine endopeptidase [Candidatus Marinimicrobia bacterium]|nr:Do family serine endopeptidase [Candidatus Neomarinimicrobiota bacterium]